MAKILVNINRSEIDRARFGKPKTIKVYEYIALHRNVNAVFLAQILVHSRSLSTHSA